MKLKSDWKIIVFLIIIALAVFLRVWHFSDWLFFKMDQARDALLIKQAYELGPGWLPLLGPKAGGTDLNLGPAFYYFQYLSAVLFQSAHPAVLAFPDLLFGILSIPLFYFFLKKFFSRNWSLILSALYAVCFLGIQYSRFAWNPNSLSFFNLLFFCSLLNVFDESQKYRLRWVILAGFSFAVSTQLHFLSFLTLPVITAIFLWKNRKIIRKFLDWKKVLVFVVIVLLLYLPVFLNEVVSGGENTHQFFLALKEKPSSHSFWQNMERDVRYWGQNWFLLLTSWISRKGGINGAILSWFGVIIPALVLGFRSYRHEEDRIKKNFLFVTLVWFFVYFVAYIPVAYQIRPRFFLPLLALPFVFIGYISVFFWSRKHKFWKICVMFGLLVIFFGNLAGTFFWFKEIKEAQAEGVRPWRTIILKAKDGITLWHLEKVVEYVKNDCGKPVVYYSASSEYKNPFRYLFSLQDVPATSIFNYDGSREGCFYAFGLTRSKKKKIDSKIAKKFDVISQEKIGALSAYKLQPKERFLDDVGFSGEKEEKSSRIFWKDVWK